MNARRDSEFDELKVLLNGGPQTSFEQCLIRLLCDRGFDDREGLSAEEGQQLSYRRLHSLNGLLSFSPDDITTLSKRLLAAHEWVSLLDGTLATVMTIHFNLCLGTILEHGNKDALRGIIEELFSLRTIGVCLATELGYGNNIVALKTEAAFDTRTQEFVINTRIPEAQKFMPNTGAEGIPKLAVVMARLRVGCEDHGVFPFVVRIKDKDGRTLPGIQVTQLGEKPGYTLDNAVTSFANVRVPFHHALLGRNCKLHRDGDFESKIASRRERFLQSIARVQAGKLCLSACAIKGAQASLQIALRYSTQRKTFAPKKQDVPVLEFNNQKKALYSALAETVAATLMYRTAHKLNAEKGVLDDGCVHRYMALTKILCTYSAQSTVLACRERIGAQGLFAVNRIIGYSSQVHGAITAEGDNQILLIKVAREMLLGMGYGAPKKSWRMFRKYDLLDVRDQQALLRERERRLLVALKMKMAKARVLHRDLFISWNENINDAIEMAQASAQRLAHENLCTHLANIQNSEEHAALKNLTLLFGLNSISAAGGWLIANKLISGRQWNTLVEGTLILLERIHPDQERWVGSFMIPDDLLRSPLLTKDYIKAYDFMLRDSANNRTVGL